MIIDEQLAIPHAAHLREEAVPLGVLGGLRQLATRPRLKSTIIPRMISEELAY